MKFLPKFYVITLLLSLFCSSLVAQENAAILFIYDASGSMWGQMEGKTKKEIAAAVLTNTVNSLPDGQQIGLMAYGHRREKDCSDVELMVKLDNGDKSTVINGVKGINPLGRTPLARSASLAIDQLKASKTKATIILITDGIESCDGNICEVIRDAKAAGVEFKLHIVGFGIKDAEAEQLKCAAEAGEGQYYPATDADGLAEVLNEATNETVDKPADNFTVFATKNGNPLDVLIRVYKKGTKEQLDIGRSFQDTASVLLPAGVYDMEVNALENTDLAAIFLPITVEEGGLNHQVISFDGGIVSVYASTNGEGIDALVKVQDPKTEKIIAQTRTYQVTKEIEVNPGTYNLIFQAIKIQGQVTTTKESIVVKPGETSSVAHDFETGQFSIGVKTEAGELIDATVNIIDKESRVRVAGGRTYKHDSSNPAKYVLTPGIYVVKVKTLGTHAGHNEAFEIEIKTEGLLEKVLVY